MADIRYIPTEGTSSPWFARFISLNETKPDDILRARLRTFGVEEYRLTMESGTLIAFLCCDGT